MNGWARALAVLLLACLIGVLGDLPGRDDVDGLHLYPVGLVPVALHQVRAPQRRAVAALALVSTWLTLWLLGTSPVPALAYAMAAVISGYVALRLLRRGDTVLPLLDTESDWARMVAASVAGALTLAAAAAISGSWGDGSSTGVLIVSAFVNGLASMLLWLPTAIRSPRFSALASTGERVIQWSALLVTSFVVFADSEYPPFSYLVLVLLCWSALRLSLAETLAQLILVRAISMTFLNHDLGPYSPSVTGVDLAPELDVLFLQLFLIACSISVVALGLTSAHTRAEARRTATLEAEVAASRRLSTVQEELEAERHRVEEMQEVDKVKDALVSTVSHELRTPITNIIGYSEMLEDGDYGQLSTQQGEAMTKIEDNSRRLLGLIDDLLTLSRMRSSALELVCAPVDLVPVARAAEEAILPRLAVADLNLEVDLPREPVVVQADTEKIERVLVNLMSNAVKFTPPGGTVTLRVATEDDWAVLEVSDTGFGIAPEDLERLFSQFFRTATAERRHIPGTGLGLSIVRSIVEAHGGHVDVTSQVDVGTTFRVHLPTDPALSRRPAASRQQAPRQR